MKTAEVFNSFLSDILKNLKIPQYSNFDPIAQNIEDPNLKAIVRYKYSYQVFLPKYHSHLS